MGGLGMKSALMAVVGWLTLACWGVERYTLLVKTTAQAAPPQITLEWDAQLTGYQISIYRRILGQEGGTWSNAPLAVVAYPQRTFSDTNVVVGTIYEYKVTRPYYDAMHRSAARARPRHGVADR